MIRTAAKYVMVGAKVCHTMSPNVICLVINYHYVIIARVMCNCKYVLGNLLSSVNDLTKTIFIPRFHYHLWWGINNSIIGYVDCEYDPVNSLLCRKLYEGTPYRDLFEFGKVRTFSRGC